MNNVNFAIPEIYGDSLSYYEVLRELIEAMNVIIDNYDTIPEQIADAVKNLDAAQLFSAVLDQLIDTIATDNTKSNNAVKVYKKHDLLYATFNETVNLYESLIDFTAGTETELIVGTNIREVNISELFIELRQLIDDEATAREQGDTSLQNAINTEKSAREQTYTTLQQNINAETTRATNKETELKNLIGAETTRATGKETELKNLIDAETTRATGKETELKNDIDGTKTSVLNEIKAWVNDTQHPIGSIYITTNNVNPSNIFGGTWEQLKDRFLIGAGSSYTNGSTGGATSHTHTTAGHTLTVNEMPSHTHYIRTAVPGTAPASTNNHGKIAGAPDNAAFITSDYTQQNFNSTGGDASHSHGDTGASSNMPPYLAVYIWKRTA